MIMSRYFRGTKPHVKSVQRTADPPGRRRRFWFGPGTLMALLTAGAILSLRTADRPAEAGISAGRINYQADGLGHMRKVDGGSGAAVSSPSRPLWKPEVSLLQEHRRELHLTSPQMKGIGVLDEAWRGERAALQTAIQDASANAST